MKSGDIVLTAFPQNDGQVKMRPALVLCPSPPFPDLLLCGITSQVRLRVDSLDILVGKDHSDYHQSGLKTASLIRPAYIAVISKRKIAGTIGRISNKIHENVIVNLIKLLRNP